MNVFKSEAYYVVYPANYHNKQGNRLVTVKELKPFTTEYVEAYFNTEKYTFEPRTVFTGAELEPYVVKVVEDTRK